MSARVACFTLGLSLAGIGMVCFRATAQTGDIVFTPLSGTLHYDSSGNVLNADLFGSSGTSAAVEKLSFSLSGPASFTSDLFDNSYSAAFNTGSFALSRGSAIIDTGSLTSSLTLLADNTTYFSFLGGAFTDPGGKLFLFDGLTLSTDTTIVDNTGNVTGSTGSITDGDPSGYDPPPAAVPVSGAQTTLIGLLGLSGAAFLRIRRKQTAP